MLKEFLNNSYLFGGNAPFIEELYEKYLANPQSIPEEWRDYFDRMQDLPGAIDKDVAHAPVVESFVQRAKKGEFSSQRTIAAEPVTPERLQVAALLLVTAYRIAGARWATVDPLKRMPRPNIPELEPAYYDLKEADLDQVVNAGSFVGLERVSLRVLVQALRDTYCRNVGFEYMFISDRAQRAVDSGADRAGARRAEGHARRAEAPAAEAHRGRAPRALPAYALCRTEALLARGRGEPDSFDRRADPARRRRGRAGDRDRHGAPRAAQRARQRARQDAEGSVPRVRRQAARSSCPRATSSTTTATPPTSSTAGGPMHLSLAFNPSHLEIVNPVVEGSVRARQRRRDDKTGDQVLPILVHGDAAFAGQGVVMETLNLSQYARIRYRRHGPHHRQQPDRLYDLRPARHALDALLHRRGEDARGADLPRERRRPRGGAVRDAQLALDFRQNFHKDVVIDIVCYRKLGHNEQDEPMVTQPLMYKKIAQHPGTRKLYADKLVSAGRGQGIRAGGDDQNLPRDAGRGTADREPGAVELQVEVRGGLGAFPGAKWTDAADTACAARAVETSFRKN